MAAVLGIARRRAGFLGGRGRVSAMIAIIAPNRPIIADQIEYPHLESIYRQPPRPSQNPVPQRFSTHEPRRATFNDASRRTREPNGAIAEISIIAVQYGWRGSGSALI